MAKQEMLSGYKQKEFFLPITEDFIPDIEDALQHTQGEIIEKTHLNGNVYVLRLRFDAGAYGLFQLGAFVQIEKQVQQKRQDGIDELFKDQLQ